MTTYIIIFIYIYRILSIKIRHKSQYIVQIHADARYRRYLIITFREALDKLSSTIKYSLMNTIETVYFPYRTERERERYVDIITFIYISHIL